MFKLICVKFDTCEVWYMWSSIHVKFGTCEVRYMWSSVQWSSVHEVRRLKRALDRSKSKAIGICWTPVSWDRIKRVWTLSNANLGQKRSECERLNANWDRSKEVGTLSYNELRTEIDLTSTQVGSYGLFVHMH